MPEIKKVFLRGKMNKDLDERLLPDGEYRDALNIQISSTEESDAGTAQNIRGNKLLKDLSAASLFEANAKCVGKIADEENDKIYWFVKGTSKQGIIEYNTSTDVSKPLVIDTAGTVLNFPDYEITGIAILDRNIIWTDNSSEPKIIDIDNFITYDTYINSDYSQTTEKTTGVDITEADITIIKKKPTTAPQVTIDSHGTLPEKPLFENKIVRFAYRWKFTNGQYSVISPFSDPVFDPDPNAGYNLDEGYNDRMLNSITKAKVFINKNSYPSNLESIDILYKEENNTNIYIYKTITSIDVNVDLDIEKESVYSVLPESQLIRQYDNVPYRAKALDIVGNRLVFGNYVDGINLEDYTPDFNVGGNTGQTKFLTRLPVSITGTSGSNNTARRTVKSGRTYQIGIAFEDIYGRQTPVISNETGLITRDFTGNLPQQLFINMGGTAPSDSRITHYKYYIKDSAAEYYNFIAENVYDDNQNTSHAWISVPSYEINKVQENDTIVLKKAANGGLVSTISKYKILDISESVPTTINDPGSISTDARFFIKVKKDSNLTTETISQGGGVTGNFEITSDSSSWVGPVYTAPTNAVYLGQYAVADSATEDTRYRYYFKDGTIIEVEDQVSTQYNIVNDFRASANTFNQTPCSSGLSGWSTTPQGTFDFTDSTGVVDQIYFKNVNTDYPDRFYICYTSVTAPSNPSSTGPAIFETVPDDNILDIYYEISNSIAISNYGDSTSDEINWYNAFDFSDGVESNRIKDDFNKAFISPQVKASTTINSPFKQKTNKSGLIYSGLYNSRNGLNDLNQFNTGETITKDLNPEYGSIQKLHARDTDLIAFCEDKILKILANKDALFNADGNVNLVSTNNVLGQAMPYSGEFGISKDPESFATDGNRIYFSDKARNAILRLSRDGLTVISSKGMKTYFRDKINNQALPIVGTYDAYSDQYIISFDNSDADKIESISFKEDIDGWVSRLGFIIEAGLSINGELYSFNSGNLYQHHHPGVVRNLFYGVQNSSGIQLIMNNEPSVVKNFKTISYEGSEAKTSTINGWKIDTIETDLQSGKIINFKNKEGKWFANISGVETTLDNLDSKEFSIQGLGKLNSYTAPDLPPTVISQPTFSNVTQNSLTTQATFANTSGLGVTYKVYFGTNSTYTSNTLYTVQTSTNTSFTPSYSPTGLTSNTTYYVTFVAVTEEFDDVLTNTANTTTLTNCSFSLSIS